MKQYLFSIRFLIPTIMIIFVIVSMGYSYYANKLSIENQIINQSKENLQNQLNYLQSSSEILINKKSTPQLQKIIAAFSSQKELLNLYITNANGKIISSNRYQDVDKHWTETMTSTDLKLIEESRQLHKTVINQSDIYMTGISPVCPRTTSDLRKTKCGFIYYRIDLNYRYDEIEDNILSTLKTAGIGILSGAILLILLFSLLLTKRTKSIINSLDQFSNGNRQSSIRVKGYDELAQISNSINEMYSVIRKNEETIIEKEARIRTLIQTMVDAVITINTKGEIQSFNSAAEKTFGYTEQEVIGKNVNMLMPEPYHTKHDQYIKSFINTGTRKIIGNGREVLAKRKNGTTFPIDLSVSELKIPNDRIFTGIIRDISQRKRMESQLLEKSTELERANRELANYAITDPLTGLYNRRYFDRTIKNELNRARREGTPLSLLLCDIDYFKLLNDTEGHQEGDERLKEVSNTLTETFTRGGDTVTRYGGEEFAVILSNTNSEQAINVATILLENIHSKNIPHQASKVADYLTLSIGVSTYEPVDQNSPEFDSKQLIKAADTALYKAKANGRNRIEKE